MPRDLLYHEGVTATSFAVWVIIVAHVPRGGREAWPSLPRIMTRLGRPDSDTSGAAKAVRALVAAGRLSMRQARASGKTHNVYTPLGRARKGDGRRYVQLPTDALDALAAGHITPAELLALARWIDAAEWDGWTGDSLATFAARWGQTARTAKTHRASLVAAGLLVTVQTRGKATATFLPGVVPTGENPSEEPGKKDPQDRGSEIPPNYPSTEPPPCELPRPVLAVGEVQVGDAQARGQAPSAQQNDSHTHHAAGRVLGALPAPYRQAQPWVRRQLLQVITRALAAGYGPDAITRYAARLTQHDLAPGREIPWLRRVLQALQVDARVGHACPECGADTGDPAVEPCPRCCPDEPDDPPWTAQDQADLDAAREFLEVTA